MSRAARWLACVVTMALGPIAVAALVVFIDHAYPTRSNILGWLYLLAAWAVGLAGIHFMPLPRANRAVIAFMYTPVIVFLMLVTVLSISCFQYQSCL